MFEAESIKSLIVKVGAGISILLLILVCFAIWYAVIINNYRKKRKHFLNTLEVGMFVNVVYQGNIAPVRIKEIFEDVNGEKFVLTSCGMKTLNEIMQRG